MEAVESGVPTASRRQKLRRFLILLSFLLFPITMFFLSPAMIFKGVKQGIAPGSLLTFLGLFVGAVFLGRVFCGWACPVAGLSEAAFGINDRPARTGRLDLLKWLIWLPWFAAVIAVTAIKGGGLHSADPFLGMQQGVSVHSPRLFIFYYMVLGAILVLSLVFGRRAMCHYVCWIAPFMILGRKLGRVLGLPSLRMRARASECADCDGPCNGSCPMSLDVKLLATRSAMEHSECVLCGACADACEKGAIDSAFNRMRKTA